MWGARVGILKHSTPFWRASINTTKMTMRSIRQADVEGKRILMRVDFNVEFDDGFPKETYKINSVRDTIDFLLSKKGVKIALLSHVGRPEGEKMEGLSFKNFFGEIGKVLDKKLIFVDDCVGDKVKDGLDILRSGRILILENVRFHVEEFENNIDFAGELAKNFDIYVNEAFSVSHRPHASLVKITEILPSFCGLHVEQEVERLSKIRENPERPSVAIIGGAKIETKFPMIKFFADSYDSVLVGGRLGIEAKNKGIVFPDSVIVPKDYIDGSLDVGPETVSLFKEKIRKSKTIIWNGPLGKFEDTRYARGTSEVLDAIVANKLAYKVAGGGETIQVIEEKGVIKKFDFVSTGGGAMLVFLAKGTLVALEALQNQK